MNELIAKQFEGKQIRVHIDEQSEPWFEASGVCEVLEVQNVSDACSRLDEDERRGIAINDSIGRRVEKIFVNEAGLYSLVFSSRKPEAKAFQKWIKIEVIPSIRKTGSYSVKPMSTLEMLQANIQVAIEHERRLTNVETSVKQIELKTDTKLAQLEKRLEVEKVNQFPEGCETLDWITETYFKGMSIARVSQLLSSANHPIKEYKHVTEDGEVRITPVYEKAGMEEVRAKLVRESAIKKMTPKNAIYIHPKIGRFYVKRISHKHNFMDSVNNPTTS